MERPESDPYRPDIVGVRGLLPQPLGRGEDGVGDSPASAVDVDGDVLAVVIRLDPRPDVALVDLVTEACGFLGGASGGCHRGLPGCVWARSGSTANSTAQPYGASRHDTTL